MKSKVLIVTRIQADHVLASRFNSELEDMCERRKKLISALQSESDLRLSSMRKVYTYTVNSCVNEAYLPKEVRDSQPFRVVRTWINKDEYLKHAKWFGVSVGQDAAATTCSVVYYRCNCVLVSWTGTGSALLKSNQECSDDEWQLIRNGLVPVKFLNVA